MSSMKWTDKVDPAQPSTQDTPSGQECTGTIPLMALDLLMRKAIESKIKHLHQDDVESFVWLAWVCLHYREGQLLCNGRPLDEWLKADAI